MFESYKRSREWKREQRRRGALSPSERFSEDARSALDALVRAEMRLASVVTQVGESRDGDDLTALHDWLVKRLRHVETIRLDFQSRRLAPIPPERFRECVRDSYTALLGAEMLLQRLVADEDEKGDAKNVELRDWLALRHERILEIRFEIEEVNDELLSRQIVRAFDLD